MKVIDTKSVGSYANYQIGYDLLDTNVEKGYYRIRCYGVFNVTGNYWEAYNVKAKVVDKTEDLGYKYYSTGSYTLVSKDVDVYVDDEGKATYTFSGQLTSSYQSSGLASGTIPSGEQGFPIMPRASTPTINDRQVNQPNFNIGDTIRIYINKKSSNFSHEIYLNYGTTRSRIATLPSVSNYYPFDTSRYAYLLNQTIPNDNYLEGTIELETYSGETLIGTKSCNYIAHVVNADPTFTEFSFKDVNPTTTSLTGNNQYVVTGYSNVKVTIPVANKATARKSATMKTYRIVIGNKTLDLDYSSDSDVVGTINNVSSGIIQVYAIDSRGNSTLVTKQATKVINYTNIVKTTNPSSQRNTGVGEEYTLKYVGNFWGGNFGSVTNSIVSATYKYKKTTSSTWIDGTTDITPQIALSITSSTYTENGETITERIVVGQFDFEGLIKGDTSAGFDVSNSYDIQVIVQDRLSTATYTVVLMSGKPNIAIAEGGVAIGAKYDDQLGGSLQVNGVVIEPYPVHCVIQYPSNPSSDLGGTWQQITFQPSSVGALSVTLWYRVS